MMKMKRFFMLLTVCFLLLPIVSTVVYADMIAEPYSNDFYRSHYKECVHLARNFYANSPDGSISLKKEPGSESEVKKIENGEEIHIMFTYNYDGEIWGVMEFIEADEWRSGWVPMEQLSLIYDYISFAEDHQDKFYPYEGNYEELENSKVIVLWTYPGSGEYMNAVTLDKDITLGNLFKIEHVYKDEQEREWGFSGYWYGGRNIWIYLSDPENTDIPANPENPTVNIWQPDMDNYTDNPDTGFSETSIIIILIIILITVTGVLIRIFWKPNRIKRQ